MALSHNKPPLHCKESCYKPISPQSKRTNVLKYKKFISVVSSEDV